MSETQTVESSTCRRDEEASNGPAFSSLASFAVLAPCPLALLFCFGISAFRVFQESSSQSQPNQLAASRIC